MKELLLFKSPTCGPCKLFAPVCKQISDKLEITFIEVDVTTDEGLALANQYNISHSGVAIYREDGNVKLRWEKPVPPNVMLADFQG